MSKAKLTKAENDRFEKKFKTRYADFDILGKPIFGEKDISKELKSHLADELAREREEVLGEVEKKVKERKKLYKQQFDRAKKVLPKNEAYIVVTEFSQLVEYLKDLKTKHE